MSHSVRSGTRRGLNGVLAAGLLWAHAGHAAEAQSNRAPYRIDPYVVHSGVHRGAGKETINAFTQSIRVHAAPWLRLTIGEYNLGTASFIRIRSATTGAEQTMSATALRNWHNHTAFFGGDTLDFELHVAPDENDIFVQLSAVWVGLPVVVEDPDWAAPAAGDSPRDGANRDLCGGDDRVASTDPRVGRIFGGGCTAWLAANGAFLTAGHCVDGDPDQSGPGLPDGMVDPGFLATVVEFNVPPSLSNGTPQPALPEDQYPISGVFIAYQFVGSNGSFNSIGADWAVFHAGANTETGLTPQQAQNAFFRVRVASSNTVGETLRVTGYGLDWTPAGTGGPSAACCDFDSDSNCDFICGMQSFIEQTATGPATEFVDNGDRAWLRYEVDTTPATSGSPVIRESNGNALGINTNSGCTNGGNWGVTFNQDALHDFLNAYIYGSGVAYADAASSCPLGCAGTIFNPHNTVADAVADVANGSSVVIIPGNYTAANGNVFTAGADGKAMTFIAPFGGVVIGN